MSDAPAEWNGRIGPGGLWIAAFLCIALVAVAGVVVWAAGWGITLTFLIGFGLGRVLR